MMVLKKTQVHQKIPKMRKKIRSADFNPYFDVRIVNFLWHLRFFQYPHVSRTHYFAPLFLSRLGLSFSLTAARFRGCFFFSFCFFPIFSFFLRALTKKRHFLGERRNEPREARARRREPKKCRFLISSPKRILVTNFRTGTRNFHEKLIRKKSAM